MEKAPQSQPRRLTPAHLQLVRTLGPIARLTVWAVAAAGIVQPAVAQTRCEASAFGMRPGADNNVAALTKTLAKCAGQRIHIAQGVYTFSPTGLAAGIAVPPPELSRTHVIRKG